MGWNWAISWVLLIIFSKMLNDLAFWVRFGHTRFRTIPHNKLTYTLILMLWAIAQESEQTCWILFINFVFTLSKHILPHGHKSEIIQIMFASIFFLKNLHFSFDIPPTLLVKILTILHSFSFPPTHSPYMRAMTLLS